ncbi:MAG: BREX-1 system phosphatase PglZ type A [Candidatus Cloacimonadaceae bacterium]|nr:BREX-1 system phosphatase PglZ type A [Candidatus Cloacimonadaceae bacterium]
MKLENIITQQFDTHRLLFWYDEQHEFREEYWALELPDGIEKIEVSNDEFGIKYRILMQEPDKKFLLYFASARPHDTENWLLDLLLSNQELHIDPASLLLQELGLSRNDYIEIPRKHKEFFAAARRIADLKKLLTEDESLTTIRWKMVSVCTSSDMRKEEIILSLLAEDALGSKDKLDLITRCKLQEFLWKQIQMLIGYTQESPSFRDLAIDLFNETVKNLTGDILQNSEADKKQTINKDGIYLLKLFKTLPQYREAFEAISEKCVTWLRIETWMTKQNLDDLMNLDLFEVIEKRVLSELTQQVSNGIGDLRALSNTIQKRKNSHWYYKYETAYNCLLAAADYFNGINTAKLDIYSLSKGFADYSTEWFNIDYQYRKFNLYYNRFSHYTLFEELSQKVEQSYVNHYLFKLNTGWSAILAQQKTWINALPNPQTSFWEKHVIPITQTGKKIFVIISDALRFEIASELMSRIRQEDRYEAELTAMQGVLPSITAVGMAALLPHHTIELDESGNVTVDGLSSSGTENRAKVLDKHLPGKALAIRTEEVMSKNSDEGKKLYRDYDVIYVYHNVIDATGDKLVSEAKVFEAVETALNDLVSLVRKLTSANANNIIITADHGFLYQQQELSVSSYLNEEISLPTKSTKFRRGIIGKGFEDNPNVLIFRAEQLGLHGDIEVAIPRGNQRMRQSGSGSRYVHGGASLQEICIPLLKINKKRVSDTNEVEVEIRTSGGRNITSGVLVFRLYQTKPVDDKLKAVTLRIGLFNQLDEPVSELKTMVFDSTSLNDKERDIECRFLLSSKAGESINDELVLKLEQPIPGTNKYKLYKDKCEKFTISRIFGTDF